MTKEFGNKRLADAILVRKIREVLPMKAIRPYFLLGYYRMSDTWKILGEIKGYERADGAAIASSIEFHEKKGWAPIVVVEIPREAFTVQEDHCVSEDSWDWRGSGVLKLLGECGFKVDWGYDVDDKLPIIRLTRKGGGTDIVRKLPAERAERARALLWLAAEVLTQDLENNETKGENHETRR